MIPDDHISPQTRSWRVPEQVRLESGALLDGVRVAFRTWGVLNQPADNAVLVCHALTGSADADRWWAPLFGAGQALDPKRDFIVCANVLGGCYGTTGPTSTAAGGQRPYGADFPLVTIRDMVRLQGRLLKELGVRRLRLVIGGSMGGMQVLEWGALEPLPVATLVAVAVGAQHSPWCIGWSAAQRQAIRSDPAWQGGHYPVARPPAAGLANARMIAMSTYRSSASFAARFARQRRPDGVFEIASYLRCQGGKLAQRFDPNTYLTLSAAMDSHDLWRDRSDLRIEIPTLVVSVDSDMLYPPAEQEQLVEQLDQGEIGRLQSIHGHDGFLIDIDQLDRLVVDFRQRLAEYVPA